jgi:hypothetical protein
MRFFVALTIACLLAAAAHAGLGSFISSFAVPDVNGAGATAGGIASDGTYIWVHAKYIMRYPVLWKFVFPTGSVVASYASPIHSTSSREGYGMDYRLIGGQPRLEVAVVDPGHSGSYIYRLTTTASVVSSVRVPAAGGHIRGICWDGSNNWITVTRVAPAATDVYRLDSNASVLSSFRINQLCYANGLFRDGSYFWFSVDTSSPTNDFEGVYKTNTLGSVVSSFDDYQRLGQGINDCCYDSGHIWISYREYVLCYDARSCEPGIIPASLGRVKAIYR